MSETLTADPTLHVKPLQEIAALVPEIAQNIDIVTTEGGQLVSDYAVEPAFFEEPANVMLFAGLARRRFDARAENGGTDEDRTFVDAASKMLFMGHSARREDFIHELGEGGDSLPESEIVLTYDKLTNHQVTAELQAAFNGGLLDDVKTKLNITDDNEQLFTLHVLNMGADSMFTGLEPTDTEDRKLFEAWKSELIDNNQAFMRLTGGVGSLPAAQTMHMDDGSKHMLIPLPVAEKILHPELINQADYDEIRQKRDLGMVKHEYVHTQRPTIHSHVGFALEERRADYLAGTQGYQDLMWLSTDLRAVTGISLNEIFDTQKVGAGQAELYANLINQLGLDTTLQLALTLPKAYDAPERVAQSIVANYIGGYDGILKQLYAKAKDIPDMAQKSSERLDEYAQKFITMFGDGDRLQFVLDQRKRFGFEFMNGLLVDRIQKLSESR